MAPNVPGSVIQTLVNLGITISKGAELRTVTVGFNEIMELLKGSLLSKTPLTDLILHQTNEMASVRGNDLHHRIKQGSKSNSKRMIVKAVVQISTNEFLFYKAGTDFIDFLFSLLTIPLGAVEYLLDGNTSLRNIDNLYRSITELIDEKYMTSQCTRNRLIKPELPPKYLSKYQIFPLTEQTTPSIYYFESHTVTGSSNTCVEKGYWMCVKDPKGEGCYIKVQNQMYIVLPHLMVIDCISSSIGPILEQLKIPSCDVKELEIEIGLEEALSILKASLVSDSALVDVLIPQVLKEPGEGKK
ncbi:PREDICTED: uncharacterized protein LOC105977471 [Erythranthe guttata]|uniref:uncharacterized protein LOC105977471 n=1 Tax=Erythranthe guttata TaxID=4155 RepID=UPI00064DEEF4|nr:PREDICTED: uncharacterized protein LOC105977471 [Erythranthe guttata]|eukprot:XP_012858234.1 PREDICTED: uncharacterized protein LOC105977471 [Erythranthe guttata]